MYRFSDFLRSSDPKVKKVAKTILLMHTGLDNVVKSKSSYLDSALRSERSKEDALIDILGQSKVMIDEVWADLEVKKHRRL